MRQDQPLSLVRPDQVLWQSWCKRGGSLILRSYFSWCWCGSPKACVWVSGTLAVDALSQTRGSWNPLHLLDWENQGREGEPYRTAILISILTFVPHGYRPDSLHAADNSLGPGREGHSHYILSGAASVRL